MPIYANGKKNGPFGANQGFSTASQDVHSML